MSQLYLHVGHGKTGSSYIQSSLALSQDVLLERGIDYPESKSASRAKKGRITSGNGAMLRSVVEQHYEAKEEKVLLSSEVLFHDIVDGKLDSVLDQLGEGRFTSVNILLFTRDLVEHAASSYQQMIKRGGSTISIEDMFSRYKQPELVSKFIDRCQQYSNIKITICNYSNCKSNVLQEVESWLDLPQGLLIIPGIDNVNRSMTRSELRLQKGINSVLGMSGQLVSDRLCDSLPDIKPEKSLPAVEIQQAMLNRLKSSYEYVDAHASSKHQYNNVTISVDEDSLRDDNYVFTGRQIDTVAQGLAGEIKRLKSPQPQLASKPDYNSAVVDFPNLSKKLAGKFDRHSADTLRDVAMCFESAGDLSTAHYFMSLALKARPTGKLIKEKVSEYSTRLKKRTS